MRRYLPFVIVAAVALLTIGSGAMLYRAKRPALPRDQTAAEKNVAGATHVRGEAKAPVTIEEFGDFECPPCGKLSVPLNQLERDYAKRVRLVFRQHPLANHVHARAAAYASEAAGLQGRFWEMHDLLYREQEVWSKTPDPTDLFISYARMLNLDVARFQKEVAGSDVKARVATDQQRAADLGVTVTPTVFVNGQSVAGPSLNAGGLRSAIDAALAAQPAR